MKKALYLTLRFLSWAINSLFHETDLHNKLGKTTFYFYKYI